MNITEITGTKRQSDEPTRLAAYTAVFTKSWATAQTKVIDDIPATTSKTQPTDTADSAENKSDNKKSPKTGVNGNMQLWLALLFISDGAVISISFKSKKKNRHG